MTARLNIARFGLAATLLGVMLGCAPDAPTVNTDRDFIRESQVPPLSPPGDLAEPKKLFENEAGNGEKGGLTEPVVERGSGRVVGQPRSASAIGIDRNDAGDITLNVVDADIRDVVRLVLEDGLGANYVIDPAITGTITVRTSRSVPADDVVGILNSVLNLNGAALIEQGDLYKVVPAERASTAGAQPGIRSLAKSGKPGSGIQVAPIRYADAAQLAELLQPFVANQGAVQLDAARNTLLLVGSADQVATMTDLIDMFDVDWMAGMSFGLYPLDEVTPTQLAEELDQIFGDPENEITAGGLRLVPIDRLGALLVITAQPDYLDRAASWIQRLDKPGEGTGVQVFVYAVQNGRAADLASVLGELFDIRSTAVGEPSLLAPGLEPIGLESSLPTFGEEGQPLDETSTEPDRFGTSRSSRRTSGSDDTSQRELTQGRDDNETRIVADETSNSLLIRSTVKEYKKIQSALRELDKQPLQVLLEATIAEVSLEDELSYGIQWFLGSNSSNIAFSDRTGRSVGEFFPSGFTGLLSRGDVRVAIDALDTVTDVKVISSPQILVLDNQTAQLEVGDEVSIATREATSIDTNDAPVVQTFERRQTGVILNVTPRVNATGLVVLDIEQEVSDVVRTDSGTDDRPTIAHRRIGTSVAVGSDQTVVLGGLIQDDVQDIQSGIPFLKDLPGLGALFGNTTQIDSRTELLVLITPKVLTNQREAAQATNELRRRLRSLEPLLEKIQNLETDVERDLSLTRDDVTEKNFMVQLASVETEIGAWTVWDTYQKNYAQDIAGLQPTVERTTAGKKPTYRLQVGPFQRFGRADNLCSALKKKTVDCLVIEKR